MSYFQMSRVPFPSTRFLAVVVCVHLATVTSSAYGNAIRTVALSGHHAPGTPDGTNFNFFAPPRTRVLPGPVLNDAGQVAFHAFLIGNGVDESNSQGIWSEGFGALALMARNGHHAPDTPSGVNFLEFFPAWIVLNDIGETAFIADLSSGVNRRGIWLDNTLVVRSGDQAPELSSGAKFDFSDSPFPRATLNDASNIAFSAGLGGNEVDETNDTAVWSGGSGSLLQVARKGNQAPGAQSGIHFKGFGIVSVLNDTGQTAFRASLIGDGVNDMNDEGIWSNGSGSVSIVARSGDQAPDTPLDVVFGSISFQQPTFGDPSLNKLGQTAFWARVNGDGVDSTNDNGIWSESSGALGLVARSGSQAPGRPNGEVFDLDFSDDSVIINSASQTAFYSAISSGGGSYRSIWLGFNGGLALIARTGTPAPGVPNEINFDGFASDSIVLNDAGQIAFFASAGSGGIWATDRSGILKLVTRVGDLIEVAPDELRTISNLGFIGGTGNSDGRPSGFNNLGQLAFYARFTDGSEGIFVSNLVAVPEPESLLIIALFTMIFTFQNWRHFAKSHSRGL